MSIAAHKLDQELSLQELIRGSVPDRPSSSSSRVPPLSDDEIGHFYCGICMERKLVFDRFRATGACPHEFCIACIVGHIEARVADGAVPVPCPAAECTDRDGATMHPEACKKLLDIDVFDAWCVALCERAVGPRRARCPYGNCGDLVALDAGCGAAVGAVSKATCPSCSGAFCLQCDCARCRGTTATAALAKVACWTGSLRGETGCAARAVRRCGSVFCYGCGSSLAEGMCRCFASHSPEDF